MATPGTLAIQLAETSLAAPDLPSFRDRVLELLAPYVAFDAGIFHQLSPRSPLSDAALHNVDERWFASTLQSWDGMAVAFAAMTTDALAHAGLALSHRAFAARKREHKEWKRRVERPLRANDVAMLHLGGDGRVISALVLTRRRSQPLFSSRDARVLTTIANTLTICDLLHQHRSAIPIGLATQVACVDTRLTSRQRQVIEHVALGHTNLEIGTALGISQHTVRNLLANASSRLDAANRAETVHRAVFR